METLSLNVPANMSPEREMASGVAPSSAADDDRLKSSIGVSLKNVLSSDFVLPEDFQWFVMRASYGKNRVAEEVFKSYGLFCYIPCETVQAIDKQGKKVLVRKPLFSNYIFLLSTLEDAKRFVAKEQTKWSLPYLHFAYDHTSQNEFGRDHRMTVQHFAMTNFIRLAEFDTYKVHSVDVKKVRFVKDEMVRIIDGAFKGIVGRVARIHNQTTVVVTLEGVASMTTAYIPQHFMVPVTDFD